MKVLYGIQGTGHGHISRAREILPELSKRAEIDVMLSGYNCQLTLDGYDVVRKRGMSFRYDSTGSVDVMGTALDLRPVELLEDIRTLDLDRYDVIISDFEPVTAWAAKLQGRACIAMSHQAAFLAPESPRPARVSWAAEQVMKYFAPSTEAIGFHFQRYAPFIEPPVIRRQIRELTPSHGDHITVYLPAFHPDVLSKVLQDRTGIRWEIFSPYCESPTDKGNISVRPVGNEAFLRSLETCHGVLTSGGFETCAECMFLDKTLIVMPILNQYEQLCNTAALNRLGIPSLQRWDASAGPVIDQWLREAESVHLPEYADAGMIAARCLSGASGGNRVEAA